MKKVLQMVLVAIALSASSVTLAVTIDAQVEGPLLNKERVLDMVRQNLVGEIANAVDLERGGKHRVFVRVSSKHVGPGSRFLYLTEVQLQRRVTDVDTQRKYWASLRSAVLWGNVPTENEVRESLIALINDKVRTWQLD